MKSPPFLGIFLTISGTLLVLMSRWVFENFELLSAPSKWLKRKLIALLIVIGMLSAWGQHHFLKMHGYEEVSRLGAATDTATDNADAPADAAK